MVVLKVLGKTTGKDVDSFSIAMSDDGNRSTRWNPQVFAGAGYVAILINPHGSTGMEERERCHEWMESLTHFLYRLWPRIH